MDKEVSLKGISGFILRLFGWKIFVNYPRSIKKLIYVVVPHTSNWDFPLGLLVRNAAGIKAQFIGKHTLFFFPLGIWMRWMGGISVNRNTTKKFVDQVVELYDTGKAQAMAIAPEGTRKKVEKLKTGYYHIARKANIPIIPVQFDWKNKRVVFDEAVYATEDSKADLEKMEKYFSGIEGRVVEKSFVTKL